jgi:hypothetical protein
LCSALYSGWRVGDGSELLQPRVCKFSLDLAKAVGGLDSARACLCADVDVVTEVEVFNNVVDLEAQFCG